MSRDRRGARPLRNATAIFRYRKEVLADSPPDVRAWPERFLIKLRELGLPE